MKKINYPKPVRLLIAVLVLLLILSACGDNTDEPKESLTDLVTSDDIFSETEDKSSTDTEYIPDKVPTDNLDYDNKVITLLTWSDVEHEEFKADTISGEPVNDAIFNRNLTVEERLGINLEFVSTPANTNNVSNWINYVQTAVQSGDNTFDLMAAYSQSMGSTVSAGYCQNLLDTNCLYLNFDMPWWPERLITEATINEKLYFCSGDISANALYMMHVCYVNNDIISNMELPDVFGLVDSNQWTYEKFIEMCEGVYIDNDGNGQKNVGDRFGYMTSYIYMDPWFYGSGALIVDKDSNGNLQFSPSFGGERVIKTLEILNNLLWNTEDGIYTGNSSGKTYHPIEFNNGNLLFAIDRARISITKFSSEKLQFSIVPVPKYDEHQENFVTVMGNPFSLYAIPIDVMNDELPMLSAILEVYASESYRQLTPALYEITLKTKYVQESESARMYDIIRENLTFDLGRIFAKVLIGQGAFRSAVEKNTAGSWASTAQSYSKIMPRLLANVVTVYKG